MELLHQLRLKYLKDDIVGDCKSCSLCETRKHIVFGSGAFEKNNLF